MPVPAPPRPVMSRGVLGRLVVTAAIVVIMLAVAVIALKLGVRDEPDPAASGTGTAAASAPPAASAQANSAQANPTPPASARIQAPVTSAAPKPRDDSPQIPRDPADLGVLVNKDHGLEPTSYAPENLRTLNGQQLRADATDALEKLMRGAAKDGHNLKLLSGYRSAAEQDALRNSYEQRYGTSYANTISAPAGFSEHQTGLAADVGNGRCDLEKCFGQTPAGKWVAKNASKYGFTVRYPLGQEESTGYAYEPWHLRYLGSKTSKDLVKSKAKTLEQYYGLKP